MADNSTQVSIRAGTLTPEQLAAGPLHTKAALARRYKLSRDTIRREIRSGRLLAVRIHSRELVPEAAVLAWLASCQTASDGAGGNEAIG